MERDARVRHRFEYIKRISHLSSRRTLLYRFLFASILCGALSHAGPVYLDDSFPVSTRPTLQALADDVWDLIGVMFHNQPPLDLPIYCSFEKAAAPLTTVREDRIAIRVTAGDTHYAQFAFQLA